MAVSPYADFLCCNKILNYSSEKNPIYSGILKQLRHVKAEKTGSQYPLWITGSSINSKSTLTLRDMIPAPSIINRV